MKLLATINGQSVEIDIPDVALTRGALTKGGAANYLSVSEKTIWRLQSLGKITKTDCGVYPVASLNEYLADQIEKAKR